ncbi:MAG: capsule assembly Wzi family protein [Tannerella sp.]|jgi:hypothetical protein|nr:capsule assembly Wzi family protein [Tannerella sp.]
MRQLQIFILFLFLMQGFFYGVAQEKEADGTDYTMYRLKTSGSLSSGGQTPFWLTGNRYGIVPLAANNGYLQAGLFHRQPLGHGWEWQAGLDMVAATPRYRKVYVQQIFGTLAYRWIHLNIGSRGDADYYRSMLDYRLSSGDMGLSTNSRPIPEINLYIPHFVTLPFTGGWLHGKGNFAVGRSFDTDYLRSFARANQTCVKNVLWHNKSLYLNVKDTRNDFPVSMTLGIQHIAQWGGISTDPRLGVQPHALSDFLRIIFGKAGDSNASLSDQINALGAHYGTYDFRLNYAKQNWAVSAYYQHLFSDASGIEFKNGWDGLKGVQLDLPTFPWLHKAVIEYVTTLHQSGPFHFIEFDHDKYPGMGGGGDNYYNNGEYTTGASYFNRGLGSPLLLSPEYNTNGTPGFNHTRIRAWHLGTEGNLTEALSYRLMVSAIESFGKPYAPTPKKLTDISFTMDFRYLFRNSWSLSASLAADRGSLLDNQSGFSVSIAKWGWIR